MFKLEENKQHFANSAKTTCALSAGGCDRRTKRGREEPPHVRGQGQKPGGPHARRAAAKRSYPTSEVRGSCQEYQTEMVQERLRGATPRLRSWAVAESARLRRCRNGPEELPLRPGMGPGGATPQPRPGAAARRTNPTPRPGAVAGNQPDIQGAMAVQAQEGLEELSHVEGQEGRQ